jgi:glycosyltransferase involved in cell wall biosynthesis
MAEKRHCTVDIVMLGTFGLRTRGTLQARALPFARSLSDVFGLRCAIVTTPWDDPQAAGLFEQFDGVFVVNTRAHSPFAAPLAAAEQLGWIRRLRPRLIHVMKPKGFGGLSAAWIMARQVRPTVFVDEDDWEGDGGWNDAAGYGVIARRLFAFQELQLLHAADHVTASSTLIAERCRRIRGTSGESDVTVLPNGLALDWLDRLGSGGCAHRQDPLPSILLYSRFAEFSSRWLEAFLADLDSRLGSPTTIEIVGESDGFDLNASIYQFLHFRDHGYVERARLPELLGRATVAIYPYEDTLINRSKQSVKLLELMASGLPVVASDVGDVRRIGGDGIELVRAGGPAAFAATVAGLIADERRRAGLSASAKRRARQFTIERLTARLYESYLSAGVRFS